MKILVIGAGHAGVEAALASARMGIPTVLITMDASRIAIMPCNPSIGGPAKGIVVREIDALGGQMGITADKTALQFKLLNSTKGPGVQCLRVQSDKIEYSKMMHDVVHNTENLNVLEAMVESIVVENNKVVGVMLENQGLLEADAIILTSGTYMSSKILVGSTATPSGPEDQRTTNKLSASLRDLGLKTFRLKTGTPPPNSNNSGSVFKFFAVASNAAFSINSKLGVLVETEVYAFLREASVLCGPTLSPFNNRIVTPEELRTATETFLSNFCASNLACSANFKAPI